jgi:outer membrane lipoprotein-sorting protein
VFRQVKEMRSFLGSSLFTASVLAALAGSAVPACAQDLSPDEIIRKFAAKEAEFRKARENYTYRQSVKIEELDGGGNVQGKWEIVSDIVFGPNKQRTEKVVYAPPNTLRNILLTPQDDQDLRSVQPFVLTADDIGKYDIHYVGKQKVDEIDCYQFNVKPKQLAKGERYFEGDIWVDDRDLQIVKTFGKGVGQLKKSDDNQFPKFETYREQIDGKYWFPTYTRANDTLHFRDSSQRIRMTVKYENYKRFGAESSITFGDVVNEPQH